MDSLEDRVKEIGKIEEERKRKEYLQRLKNFPTTQLPSQKWRLRCFM